jgi:two-component system heavy metal sensor histidine kinase CusS
MTIRVQLTLWYAAVLSGALALFGGLTYFILQHRLLGEIDRELEGTTGRFQSYFLSEACRGSELHLRRELQEFCQALPPATIVNIHGANGFTFRSTSEAASLKGDRWVHHRFTFGNIAFDLDVATNSAEPMHTLQLLRILLISLIPLVILAASLGGAWLSRRALKPVNEITEAARMIGIENLSRRLPVPATRDEFAKLSEVLNSMFERLESAVKTLSQFVADASHELRTPIAVIRTTAELSLRRARSAESYRASLEGVTAEAERMTQLVEDLLTIARGDAQTAEMPLAPLDVSDVLKDVCAEMAGLADLKQIEIHADLARRTIAANRTALHRLFIVLLDNAVKYTNPGGRVLVRVEDTSNDVRVSIEDSGQGIDVASLPHIFQRFYRADASRTGAGHGLGLSLAESIARAHGATIGVHSEQGIGSRFEILFPRRARPKL